MSFGHLLAIALILIAPSASFAFGLMTSKESVRATAATDGLLYCLSKGHEVFRVEAPRDPHVEARDLAVKPEAVERMSACILSGCWIALPAGCRMSPKYGTC
jgi:hypothetical protein